MRSGLQFRSTCATTSAVAGSISSVTRADEETQDDVFAGLRTGERHGTDSSQHARAGSSSSEADAPGLSPHEPCLASAQGRELVIALSLRVVW
jgi:hypothetical protein